MKIQIRFSSQPIFPFCTKNLYWKKRKEKRKKLNINNRSGEICSITYNYTVVVVGRPVYYHYERRSSVVGAIRVREIIKRWQYRYGPHVRIRARLYNIIILYFIYINNNIMLLPFTVERVLNVFRSRALPVTIRRAAMPV